MATELKKTDVVIVGLGAVGGVAVLPIVEAGLNVVGLEAGTWLRADDFAPDELRNNYRGWPQAVQPSQMLALVQLVHWPAAALRAALPLGWTLEDDGDRRVLHRGGDPVLSIAYTAGDRVEIRAAHDAFEVLIESVPVEPAR